MARAMPVVIALHVSALAGDYRHRATVAGHAIGAGEAGGGGERESGGRSAGAGTAGIGDAWNGERRLLTFKRASAKVGRLRLSRIIGIELRELAVVKELGRGKPGERILRGFAGHRETTLDECSEGLIGQVRRRRGR